MKARERVFDVRSAADGQLAIDYFNGFHDGFIRRIEIVSRDRFEVIGAQTADGIYDVSDICTAEFAAACEAVKLK